MSVTVAVLAGGLGSRIGGDKSLVELGGRPLITYPLEAAAAAGLNAVVVAKRHTRLPRLAAPILLEPDAPVHPLVGVLTALGDLPVVIALPCDMPFVSAADLVDLAELPDEIATLWPGQPFPSLYRAEARPKLQAVVDANQSMRSLPAHAHRAQAMSSSDELARQRSINTREDLLRAEMALRLG